MRVRILLLHANDHGKRLSRFAEQILTDVSAAFGHVFSIMHEKIGEASEQAYGVPLTHEAADAAAGSASLLLAASPEDAVLLQDALNLSVEITSFCVPGALCGRNVSPASLWVAQSLATDAETLNTAAAAVYRYAASRDVSVSCIAPSGAATKSIWEAALANAKKAFPGVRAASEAPGDAMQRMILRPVNGGIIFCTPYAGSMFKAAAEAVCSFPNIVYSASLGLESAMFAAGTAAGHPNENPISLACAIAELLRGVLKMENEAACVEAAISNVLLSGWHTDDLRAENAVKPERIVELICEQISVAGEFMDKGAFSS